MFAGITYTSVEAFIYDVITNDGFVRCCTLSFPPENSNHTKCNVELYLSPL